LIWPPAWAVCPGFNLVTIAGMPGRKLRTNALSHAFEIGHPLLVTHGVKFATGSFAPLARFPDRIKGFRLDRHKSVPRD
jgi:hypothetical protein